MFKCVRSHYHKSFTAFSPTRQLTGACENTHDLPTHNAHALLLICCAAWRWLRSGPHGVRLVINSFFISYSQALARYVLDVRF